MEEAWPLYQVPPAASGEIPVLRLQFLQEGVKSTLVQLFFRSLRWTYQVP